MKKKINRRNNMIVTKSMKGDTDVIYLSPFEERKRNYPCRQG